VYGLKFHPLLQTSCNDELIRKQMNTSDTSLLSSVNLFCPASDRFTEDLTGYPFKPELNHLKPVRKWMNIYRPCVMYRLFLLDFDEN